MWTLTKSQKVVQYRTRHQTPSTTSAPAFAQGNMDATTPVAAISISFVYVLLITPDEDLVDSHFDGSSS
jgi:hypothetical protein